MYPASDDFHKAVRDGNDQMPLLIFSDAVFTASDIDVDSGIVFDDNFSLDEDISIGQTPSNEIQFSLFNDSGYLNNYVFGEFIATLGVKIREEKYTQVSSVIMMTQHGRQNVRYEGSDVYPFIRRNGIAMTVQPNFAVKSLMGYDGKVWAFAADGRHAVYDDNTGANITPANKLIPFMKNKVKGWAGYGYYYNKDTRILSIFHDGTIERYEFVPLGVFVADRPNVPDEIRVDMSCHDRMMEFEKDWPGFKAMGITFPTTVGTIFQKMCEYLKVPYKIDTFVINRGLAVSKEPTDKFENVTMRTVLSWIAEVAASNARFDRDGNLIMDWIRNTTQSYGEGDYYDFKPYWYTTEKVQKLYNRSTSKGKDDTVGTGKNGYLIQDNPFIPV